MQPVCYSRDQLLAVRDSTRLRWTLPPDVTDRVRCLRRRHRGCRAADR